MAAYLPLLSFYLFLKIFCRQLSNGLKLKKITAVNNLIGAIGKLKCLFLLVTSAVVLHLQAKLVPTPVEPF